MAIKTLNTLLSLIPKGDDKGRGDKGDNKPKGDDKANDKGKGEDNGDSGENGESGDSSDSDNGSDKGSDSNGHGNDDVGGDEKGTTMEDFKDIAGDIVNEIMNGGDGGLKDKDDVVQEVATEERDKALSDNVQAGEAAYAPSSTTHDKVKKLKGYTYGDGTPINADILQASASITAPLRNGLLRLVRGMETIAIRHGTRTGRSLSERRYAQTWGSIKSGTKVKRAYKRKSDRLDTSIACSIVVDQSGSMNRKLVATQMGMLALASAISDIGGKCEVIGYTTGNTRTSHVEGSHRSHSVNIDVFMDYGERFNSVKDRFGRLQAKNYTPTADGIQYGLEGLSERPEAHRVMFVLTDGEADSGHRPVIKRQIRLAHEAGITIIGVGLGYGTESVIEEYGENALYCPNMSELPTMLLEKLRAVFDPSEKNRGRKVRAS